MLLESVVVHEVGHQWFYCVTGNDQGNEPWLDEAVDQYVVGLYYADTHGTQAAEAYLRSLEDRWASVDRAEIPIGLPAGAYRRQEYGASI